MRLPDFKVEQWMNDYENDAIYNMTDTCVKFLRYRNCWIWKTLIFQI